MRPGDPGGADVAGVAAEGGVVELFGGGIDVVGDGAHDFGGDVVPVAVGEVAAGAEGEAHQFLVEHEVADLFVFIWGELVDGFFAEPFDGGVLDAVGEDGPGGDEVGVGTGVGLNVGGIAAKELLQFLLGEVFNGVDVVATGIETVVGISFGIFIGEQIAHRQLYSK